MKSPTGVFSVLASLGLIFLLGVASRSLAAAPDLTTTDLSKINRTTTYNLGPTGLRGWIYIAGNGQEGTITEASRQILVTVVGAKTSAEDVLAVNDVILGVAWGKGSGAVPLFTSDARKSFGAAITEAEKAANGGILRVKCWRAGAIKDLQLQLAVMGSYTATAPYNCPKSALVLANARDHFVNQLLANPSFLTPNYGGAISGLALIASVTPADAHYAEVQARLQSFAHALAPGYLELTGCDTWDFGYINIFLSEYYLSTGDSSVLYGINAYTVALSKSQSRYGTFGHGGSLLKTDGSLHGTIPPYGPVNQAGIQANISIVLGKKALVAGKKPIDPEIDPAIQRGSDFFAYYVNKGSIPYGEHAPWTGGHASNGKDSLCAVLFGLQDNRAVETEYFTRMSTAGFTGREYGHTGQGFSYLWGAMGTNMGGPAAVAAYLEKIRWHLDLERRSDGSFVYDGGEQYGAGSTADGTYLGQSAYYGISPTATYVLTYALPLKRLYITGRNAYPANTLDSIKVANAIAAATIKEDCPSFTITQLIAALSEFDPVVRSAAATELGKRTLTPSEINTLLAMAVGSNANGRMGACQILGILKTPSALKILGERLSDPDLWVRATATTALRNFGPAASPELTTMLNAFIANATDPNKIVWNDPVQIANGFLSFAIFGDAVYHGNNLASDTIKVPKNLLYPAMKAGLKQPDSNPRSGVANFAEQFLTLEDVQALSADLFEVVTSESQADTMWSMNPRASGIATLAKHKIAETIPLALAMQEVPEGFGWGCDGFRVPGINAVASFGNAARWTLPTLHKFLNEGDPTSGRSAALNSAIASINAAITAPAGISHLLPVADSQVLVTTAAKGITLTGSSCRTSPVAFTNVTAPAHGKISGTAPNLTYTPIANYRGLDSFTFQTKDSLTTSAPATVSLIVGTAGTGLKAEYFDNAEFTNVKLTRTDAEVNFDWGSASPDASITAKDFSVRWNGLLLVPETGNYHLSTLTSGGVRLYLNGVAIIDDFSDHDTSWKDSDSIPLVAGQRVDLQMEYSQKASPAVAKLKWIGPSFAGHNGDIIGKEWLYDGTGIPNRTCFAYSQNVTMLQNNKQAITLSGSGASAGFLTYSIVSQPTHGVLSGSPTALTYTPTANFSGSDSFDFIVKTGNRKSSPAKVSIGVWSGMPVAYFWTNPTTGNWSGASNWTSAAGATGTPDAAGRAFYSLNFNKAGTYTTTQDLNDGFLFNQLNIGGTVTFAGTNSLSPIDNGSIVPQINQNNTSTVTFNAPLKLASMTTLGGTGGGTVTIPSLISGTGGLTKTSQGTLNLTNVSNTYSGGTVISGGTLALGIQANQALGTGPVTLNPGGTITMNRVNATNLLILNGGTIFSDNGWGNSWNSGVTLNANTTINATYKMTFSGDISGAGGFTKIGNDILLLSGTNTFTGATSVGKGTLMIASKKSLGEGGELSIADGAAINLDFKGEIRVRKLTLGGVVQASGRYGATKASGFIKGTGALNVSP